MLRECAEGRRRSGAAQQALPARKGRLSHDVCRFCRGSAEIRDPYNASRGEREQIKKPHLLLAAANAMQPGVFSLSSWDLVGALPIPEKSVAERMEDGDYRWINRGGVDLMGANPNAKESPFGVETCHLAIWLAAGAIGR